jgi:hypothetical protein
MAAAWMMPSSYLTQTNRVGNFCWASSRKAANNNDGWGDDDVNGDDLFRDATNDLSWNTPAFTDNDDNDKLGINIGQMLDPISEKDAADLLAAATEIINDNVARGVDEIENLRFHMNKDLENERKRMNEASERNARIQTDLLSAKINELTSDFLKSTESFRKSTKLAAAADKSMQGKGIEVGVWGSLGGNAVTTTTGNSLLLLGSVAAASTNNALHDETSTAQKANRIVVVADVTSDPYAKAILPLLTAALTNDLAGLQVDVYKPTANLPIGGNNAACAIVFATSLTEASSLTNALDRLVRKTLATDGSLNTPPTHIVLVTCLGTSRTNKYPYSVQNLMSGGKLEKRLRMEEALVSFVRNRVAVGPALDYTICKLAEIKPDCNDTFDLRDGDCVDGTMSANTAAVVLKQAIAFQPSARNATLCATGNLQSDVPHAFFDDVFLRLDGPELGRFELKGSALKNFAQLLEYVRGWAELLATTGKGLTTPIRYEPSPWPASLPTGVFRQEGAQLLFLPMATGSRYRSKDEERELENKGAKGPATIQARRLAKEGGIEFLVETTAEDRLRVRVRRCNYATGEVIKELSESTIMNRFKESIAVWKTDHQE